MKITSLDRNIKELFDSGFYKIPRFQRPYSWDRDNLDEFWNDVNENDAGDYFLGSMVVYRNDSHSYNLVDGQQRLTTITILLCVIRNRLKDLGFLDLSKGIHNVIERPDINFKLQYVIQPETSYPFFQEHIQKFGIPDLDEVVQTEEKKLRDAYDYFKEKINHFSKQNKHLESKELISIRDKLLNLSFVYIELEKEEDAYIIFETLNTRGKDLAASDLIKNLFTKLIKNDNRNVDLVKDKWNKIIENIQTISSGTTIDQFLLHYWLSQGKYVNLKKLFMNFKSKIHKSNAKTQLEELVKNSMYYSEILAPKSNYFSKQETEIYESLKALSLFSLLQTAPLSLAIQRHYKNKVLSLKMAKDWHSTLEKFHFIYTAITSSKSTGGMSSLHSGAARNLANEINKDKISKQLKDLKNKLRSKIPEKEIFKANIHSLFYTSWYTKEKKLIQYILKKLTEYHAENMGIAIDYDKLTIEHLLPENPSKGRKLARVGSLGNFIFIDIQLQNKLKNKPFDQKISIIKNSRYPADEYLLNMKSLTDKEIAKRTDYLADLLYEKIFIF